VLVLISAVPALAEQRLTEYEQAPFGLAVHRWLPVELQDHTSPAGYRLAQALPPSMVAMDVVRLRWPRSDEECYLGVAQLGEVTGYQAPESGCALALMVGDGEPKRLTLPAGASGMLNRLCIWPTARSSEAELILLFTLAAAGADTPVYGYSLNTQGELREIETGGAQTLYGWFEAIDLDEDGTYELVTSRNLDGTWGGFYYHTVRSYQPEKGYIASPDGFQDYFRDQLAWLNWVVDTQALIQANPAPYLSTTGIGYVYVAEYRGRRYGFDSIIEVPATDTEVGDVEQFNRARREAFRLVVQYRDELAAWLDGGPYPATWKLPR
jgi:hypothetical protein